jgi:Uma2 family endonuclease
MNAQARSLSFASAVDDLFVDVPSRMTTKEFFAYTEHTQGQYQLLNGRSMMNPAPATKRQKVSHTLNRLLDEFVYSNDLGEMWYAPTDVVLDRFNVVQPDLFFISEQRTGIVAENNIQGAPDLVIEILSSSTADVDRGYKQLLYALHGVREYWLIDPDAYQVEVLALVEGEFGRAGVYGEGDAVTSPLLPGLRIPVDDIFAGV